MPIKPPTLQSRSFEEIVAEARRRIARYTPELSLGWTDHNDSDPGITFVQLFAWLAQITQERVNKLPERAYLSLLELLGLEVRAALPATADLVFEPIAGVGRPISVPAGTRIGAPPAADNSPVTFETEEALDVINAELAYVLTYDGLRFTDVTALNEPTGEDFHPFGERPENGAAIYFGFAPPASPQTGWKPFPSRISLRAFEPDSLREPAAIACGDAPSVARAELVWEYLPKAGSEWQKLSIYEDETRALEVGGYLSLEGPQQVETAQLWTLSDPCYWLRLRVREPDYGSRAPVVSFFRFNAVRARHQVSEVGEVLGTSDGKRDQTFRVHWTPVVPDSLVLQVTDEGGREHVWQRVSYFRDEESGDALAGPEAQVYTLDAQSGEVRFGDGYRGEIPPAGSKVIAAAYRWGGGEGGNVEADQVTALQTSLAGIKGVSNPRRAVGGANAQSTEAAKRSAPQWLRRRERAVTARDFEDAAREVGGVKRAIALPNAHPDYRGVRVPGAVTVLVVQDTKRTPPTPGEDLLRAVCDVLEEQRTLTTEVYVRSPRFISIGVEVELLVDPEGSMGQAQEKARAQLEAYLDPNVWRWGQDLYPANLQSQLLELYDEGIWAVQSLRILVDGQEHPSRYEPVRLADDELFYAGRLDITASPYSEA